MTDTITKGNRLPLPPGLPSKHFLYKTAGPALDEADVAKVVEGTKALVESTGLHPGQIEVYWGRLFKDPEVAEAFERICETVRAIAGKDCKPQVVVCEQAFPHSDPDFSGWAFLSRVLYTGPEAYFLQMFHTAKTEEAALEVVPTSRFIRAGDWFMMDPTIPHMAVPRHSNNEALLIMLQVELSDRSPEQREELVRRLPPLEGDRDIRDLEYDE